MRHNFCTIISKDSLYKGLVLYNSLKARDPDFHLFFLCMQNNVKVLLKKMNLEKVTVTGFDEIENEDMEFAKTKRNRNDKEYAWTAKAPMILHLFRHHPYLTHMVYIDADVEFFTNPDPIFHEFEHYSIMITRERFYIQDNTSWHEQYGFFNGGFMAFKNDANSMECLMWFRKKCIEWCYNRAENGHYGDQVYMNDWREKFKQVGVMKNIGINTTAWYAHACYMEDLNGTIYISDTPLVYYHYNGLIFYNRCEYDLCVFINLPQKLVKLIYVPYLSKLQQAIDFVSQFDPNFYLGTVAGTENRFIKNYYRLGGKA